MIYSLMNNIFNKNEWGMDIGSNSIKLSNVLVKGKKVGVKKYYILEDYVKGKKGSDYITGKHREFLIDNLAIFFKKNKISMDKVNFVLPSFGVFFKKMEVPLMGAKEIQKIVDYQVEGMFGQSKNNFVIDYSFVENDKNLNISFMCVYKRIFDLYEEIAKRSGFKIGKILMEQKCYCDFIKDTDYIVVDIGGEVTSFSVFHNNELEVVDNVYKGGEVLTSLYALGNNISFDEAEK